MSDVFCPRQIIFELPGNPGVLVTATERDGEIDFIIDVEDTPITTADLRALFFHFNEAKLPGLVISGGDGLLTESRIQADSVRDLGDNATLAGAVKNGFDIGLEWGTPGGKMDDIFFPVTFTLSSPATDLTLDDFGGQLFGAKLDSVGGPGGVRNQTSKLTTIAPWAPDASDDEFDIFEDGAAGLNSPSKTPQAVTLDVLADNGNGADFDNDGDPLTIVSFHDEDPHATLAISADGKTVLYTPDLDFSGVDTFEYCVSDGNGGQDHATVTVRVEAVADDPVIGYSIAQGARINEMTVTVTAKQNDADSSEFLDRIVAGSLPAGWTLTPSGNNPATEEDTIVQAFNLTVPTGVDVDDHLTFTAYSKETSNGDGEDSTLTVPIEIDFTHNQTDLSFHTDDQSIWGSGSGKPFDFNELIGLDNKPFDFDELFFPASPSPIPAFDVGISGNITFGFQTIIHLDAGNIDANLFVTTVIESSYNKTTDTLSFDTSYTLNGGNFVATGPEGNVDVNFRFAVDGNVEVSLEPLDFLTGWANIDFALPDPGINQDILNIDTNGSKVDWTILPGVTATLSWPDIEIRSDSLTGSDQDHILFVNADLDAAAAYYFPPAIALSDPVPGTDIDPQLVDIDINGFVDLFQKLTVGLDGLLGTLTLEDGSPPINFNFGDELPFISNASDHDSDGDGKVEFSVAINPDASLKSDAGIDFGVGASLYLFRDLPFDLDPIRIFDEQLPLLDFSFFNQTFDLGGFNQQSWDLFA